MTQSTYQLTVPQSLYDATCDDCGQPFADSYLYGADLRGSVLTPRTLTAYRKMMDRTEFRRLMTGLNLTLAKPAPYPGDGLRMTAEEAFAVKPQRRRAA